MALTADTRVSDIDTPWIYSKWVRPPVQNRSERTFFRFLDAAEELLKKRHWHDVSVQEIVKHAEASVGSFYNRFADKAALLHCLDDRLGQECELTISQLIEELEANSFLVEDGPAIFISLLMRLCTERAGVIRALDIARKLASSDGYTGLGPRFDVGVDRLGVFFAQHHSELNAYSSDTITRAFKETFMIARENLLYQDDRYNDAVLHRTLLLHFDASLQA